MITHIRYSEILNSPELLAEYAAECSIPEIGKTAPNAEMYAAMERSGAFQCFGVYQDERLVGFASLLTSVLPHYSRKVAIMESIFVSRESRVGGAGRKLRAIVKDAAREAGCGVILYNAPAGGSFEWLLSKQKECRRTNSVFCESLT